MPKPSGISCRWAGNETYHVKFLLREGQGFFDNWGRTGIDRTDFACHGASWSMLATLKVCTLNDCQFAARSRRLIRGDRRRAYA